MPVLAGAPYGFEQPTGWSAVLGDIMVLGGDAEALGFPEDSNYCPLPVVRGCLTLPPDGLGVPPIRTQDVSYLGRDGAQHHEDWYEPRTLTLTVAIGPDGCGCESNTSVRQAVSDLVREWRRVCNTELELVLYPPNCACDDSTNNVADIDRPLGVVGRPRQALVSYTRNGTAEVVLRFDAQDHLMYLLDCCGTAGSNARCEPFTPSIDSKCRQYDRCYTDGCWAYDTDTSMAGGPAVFVGGGTECVGPVVNLYGPLTNPSIEMVTTNQLLSYSGTIGAGEMVAIDLTTGTASEGGVDRTGHITGDLVMAVQPGANMWRLQAYSLTDSGYAEVCWRPAVIVA